MTPLPKRRHSKRRQGKRVASIKLGLPGLMTCGSCGKPRLPHRACPFCGSYAGRTVIVQREKSKKKTEKT